MQPERALWESNTFSFSRCQEGRTAVLQRSTLTLACLVGDHIQIWGTFPPSPKPWYRKAFAQPSKLSKALLSVQETAHSRLLLSSSGSTGEFPRSQDSKGDGEVTPDWWDAELGLDLSRTQ